MRAKCNATKRLDNRRWKIFSKYVSSQVQFSRSFACEHHTQTKPSGHLFRQNMTQYSFGGPGPSSNFNVDFATDLELCKETHVQATLKLKERGGAGNDVEHG